MPYFTREDPAPELPDMRVLFSSFRSFRRKLTNARRLLNVKGEWHEYESKRARKRQREEAA